VYDEPPSQAEENEILKISKTVEMLNKTPLLNKHLVQEIFNRIFFHVKEMESQKAQDCFIEDTCTVFVEIYNSLPNQEELGSLEHRYNARLLAIKERTQQLCEEALDKFFMDKNPSVKELKGKFEECMKAAENQLLRTEYSSLENELLPDVTDSLYTKCLAVFEDDPPEHMNEYPQRLAEIGIHIIDREQTETFYYELASIIEPWGTLLRKAVECCRDRFYAPSSKI
jgi:hypothetical protein